MSTVTNTQAEDRIRERVPFATAGDRLTGSDTSTEVEGYLPEADWLNYRELVQAGQVVYTVRSYDTIIGYAMRDGSVVIPEVRYSLTTTQHQHILRAAWGQQRRFDPEAYAREVSMVNEVRATSPYANGRSGSWA
jgi:hypothetical protein